MFLVCFLHDKLGWDEVKIVKFLDYYRPKWDDYDIKVTTRQVNIIFEKIKDGKLGCHSLQSSYSSCSHVETRHRETQREISFGELLRQLDHKDETAPLVHTQKIANCPEFRVSSRVERINEQEVKPIEEKKVFAKVNNGNRWYKVAEKEGQFGAFYSIDSGQLLEVTTDDGNTQLGYGKVDRFFSLPKEPGTLKELIEGLQKLLPQPATLVKQDTTIKNKK